ncbi:hypothetical protein Tco_0047294 [Tanacetum coccineum]
MSSMQEDIQCAGSDTRPPMLDRTDFESWQQRIRLYCLGKDNGENIMKSIREGPFQMGTVSDVITGGTEGAVQQGPVRARVLNDLSAEEKERYKADIRATNILLQGNMSACYENKKYDGKKSPSTENLIESLSNTLALLTQSYKSHLPQTNNQLRASSNARNKAMIQDGKVVVQDVRGRYSATNQGRTFNQGRPFQKNNARGNGVAGNQTSRFRLLQDKSLLSKPRRVEQLLDEEKSVGFLSGEQVPLHNHVHGKSHKLKIQFYEEAVPSYDTNNSIEEAPDFNSFFKIKNLEHQIKEKDNVIRRLKDLVASVNDRSREPYNAVDVTALIEQNNCDMVELEKNTMAEQNVPAQPPTRTDEQIVPRSQWLTIGKSNLLFNAQKIQKNPIFQISVDILSNTNFFQAFTASANVPAIYLQQFWKTMSYNEKTGVYSCQVDEQWFDLSADLLRKALAITPVNPTHPFELPSSGDTVIDFVNELGYPEPVEIVSSIRTNYVYQPWRAILSLLNQCLTGKTSGSDKPRHPVLQMLWGIVTQTNVDHAELIWEEFTQGIQTFFSHKASHKASLKNPKKKVTPLLIPYGRFSKVIIYYLASNNNIHRRPDSAVHHTRDDYILGNLKFVPKGESVEVFGMAIPDPLITEAIQQSSYYPKYLKMVAENTKKTPQGSASVQPATQRATPKKPTTTTPVKQTKPAPPPTKKPSKQSIPQREDDDPDLNLAKKLSLEAHQEKGEEEGNDAELERAIKLSLDPAFLPQGRAPVGGVTIRDPVSETTSKLHETVGKGKAVVSEEQVAHSLIDMSKKKRTTDQFILVRRDQTPPIRNIEPLLNQR